jgi:alpha-galactosidase
LKYDNCGWGAPEDSPTRMAQMRDALLLQSRPILFALCQGGVDKVWTWGNKTGHSWRISDDIWAYVYHTVLADFECLGSHHVDCVYSSQDMELHWSLRVRRYGHVRWFPTLPVFIVEVGNGQLTLEEQRTHFNLWALSKSPLLIGTHVHESIDNVDHSFPRSLGSLLKSF